MVTIHPLKHTIENYKLLVVKLRLHIDVMKDVNQGFLRAPVNVGNGVLSEACVIQLKANLCSRRGLRRRIKM